MTVWVLYDGNDEAPLMMGIFSSPQAAEKWRQDYQEEHYLPAFGTCEALTWRRSTGDLVEYDVDPVHEPEPTQINATNRVTR